MHPLFLPLPVSSPVLSLPMRRVQGLTDRAKPTFNLSLQVRCLNEDVDGSCRNVFRAWGARTQPAEQPLRSDADDCELLLHIP